MHYKRVNTSVIESINEAYFAFADAIHLLAQVTMGIITGKTTVTSDQVSDYFSFSCFVLVEIKLS